MGQTGVNGGENRGKRSVLSQMGKFYLTSKWNKKNTACFLFGFYADSGRLARNSTMGSHFEASETRGRGCVSIVRESHGDSCYDAIDAIDSIFATLSPARTCPCAPRGRGWSALSNYTPRIAFPQSGIKLKKLGATQHPHVGDGGGGDPGCKVRPPRMPSGDVTGVMATTIVFATVSAGSRPFIH